MEKKVLFGIVLLICLSIVGCVRQANNEAEGKKKEDNEGNQLLIENIVKEFGSKLKNVSLLAPKIVVENSMKDNYSNLVRKELIENWVKNPLEAPGRLTSSPWPDKIEVINIKEMTKYSYEVRGYIAETTSIDKQDNSITSTIPITIIVKNINNNWLIDNVNLGEYNNNQKYNYQVSHS